MSLSDSIFRTRWAHVFEEDGPDGAVYRPDDVELPRSRRPRMRISFSPDGRALAFKTCAGPIHCSLDVLALDAAFMPAGAARTVAPVLSLYDLIWAAASVVTTTSPCSSVQCAVTE